MTGRLAWSQVRLHAVRAVDWLERRPIIVCLVLVISVCALFAIPIVRVTNEQAALREHDRRYAQCVADWAEDFTALSAVARPARKLVDEHNDALWRTVALVLSNPGPEGRQRLSDALDAYVDASDDYAEVLRTHPVPDSPALACE